MANREQIQTDNSTLGDAGTLYIKTPEGLLPLGGIQEMEFTEENPELNMLGTVPDIRLMSGRTFTATITINPETSLVLMAGHLAEYISRVIHSHPNGRVKHLALHHKKRRTRKKNMYRILREAYRDLERSIPGA